MTGTEAQLCDSFMTQARDEGLVVYPETCGWDILVVDPVTGRQMGVEAKLGATIRVLAQALKPYPCHNGPEVHAVLLLKRPGADFIEVAQSCRITIITLADFCPMPGWRRGAERLVITKSLRDVTREWVHPERNKLPDLVPTGRAGLPAPVRWTKWKAGASRVLARLEIRGHVTSADFKTAGVAPSRWVQAGWIRDSGRRFGKLTVYVAGTMPDNMPPQQHPAEYAQVLASERELLCG